MVPNRFPDAGEAPEYNAVDASLWYVIAAHELLEAVRDRLGRPLDVVRRLFRALDEDRRQRDAAKRVVTLARHRGDDDRRSGDPREVRGDRRELRGHAEERRLDVGKLLRPWAEIHHQADHLVPPEGLQDLADRAVRGKQVKVLVLAVRDENIHEPFVLELVGDHVQRHLIGDACAAQLEVPEVHRHEDEPAPVLPGRPQMRP
jgi:hypothetical protein